MELSREVRQAIQGILEVIENFASVNMIHNKLGAVKGLNDHFLSLKEFLDFFVPAPTRIS